MSTILIAWVLIVNPQAKNTTSVSGIASEQACLDLGEKIYPQTFLRTSRDQRYRCYSYETVVNK